MNAQQFFQVLSLAIRSSAKYNTTKQLVEINDTTLNLKLNLILQHLSTDCDKNLIKNVVKFSAQKLADDTIYHLEQDASSFLRAQSDLTLSIDGLAMTIDRIGYLQSTIFTKMRIENLIKNTTDNFNNVESIVDKVFNNMRDDNVTQMRKSLYEIDKVSTSLNQYLKDMELPEWLGEIIARKNSNLEVVNKTVSNIEATQRGILNEYNSESVQNALNSCVENAYAVKSEININNDLLTKIELDISKKQTLVQNIISALSSFKMTAADGFILKILQSNDKVLSTSLNKLSAVIGETPKYFDTVESIDTYIAKIHAVMNETQVESILNNALNIESQLDVQTRCGDVIRGILNNVENLENALLIQKNDMLSSISSPIHESAIIWERSTLQSFETFFANISKSIIGESNHVQYFGNADCVEELRRVAEKVITSDQAIDCDVAYLEEQILQYM